MSSSASSDEGEIRDGVGEKANTTLSQFDGTSVDRPDRNRHSASTSLSPDHEQTARETRPRDRRSRSPYSDRARGTKRPYYDDYNDRNHGDPRRFKIHYEDTAPGYRRRSRGSYQGMDREKPSPKSLTYDDHGPPADKRRRTRSPRRGGRQDRNDNRNFASRDSLRQSYHTNGPPVQGLGIYDSRGSRHQSVSNRGQAPLPTDQARHEAKTAKGLVSQQSDLPRTQESEKPISTIPDTSETFEAEPIDEAALIEERRKRREAIKAKYRSPATPLLVQALHLNDKNGQIGSGQASQDEESRSTRSASPASAPPTPLEVQLPASPSVFAIANDQELANQNGGALGCMEDDGPSAADYDPTVDMREDKQRDDQRHIEEVRSGAYDELKPSIEQDVLLPTHVTEVKPKKAKDDFDMFAEDDDDMFAEEPKPVADVGHQAPEIAKAVPVPTAKELDIGMLDNWDDAEGYYKVILGELLNGRYHVQTNLGKGMFSGVVRAMDKSSMKLVAVKIIRNNETMRKAGAKEIEILQKINQADPEDKKHMIRLERSFEHKNHLCMVFENLSINLREVLKKFGRDVGINLRAVRAYAQQMFLGLSLMKKCNILHADLKPDNILVNETRNMLKICDLGSASDASENEITPYLVSRFYRAPEIILGMPYDFAIDVWSVGCTLYELYTGKILFTGRTNNQMLRSIMDCRGKFTTKMLKKAQFAHVHFDELANFRSVEQDKLTGKDTIKTLNFSKPSRDLRTRLTSASKGLTESETKELALFADLLDKCLALNPEKRCTPAEALKHPFILKVGSK